MRASLSFGVSTSTSPSKARSSGRAGAGSSIVCAPSPRASARPAATVSSGVSSWNNANEAPRNAGRISPMSAGLNIAFAPGATTIEFRPAASTWMIATPVAAALEA